VLDRGPLVAAHLALARVSKQIDQHVLRMHLEQVEPASTTASLRCCLVVIRSGSTKWIQRGSMIVRKIGAFIPTTVLAGRPTGERPALSVDPGRLAEEDRRFVEKSATDGLRFGDGLAEGNEIDDVALERHHRAEGLLVHGADGP